MADSLVPTESIGEFGSPDEDTAAAGDVNLDFTWYGEKVRVHPYASELDLMEFLAAAGYLSDGDPAIIPPLVRFLQALVHPEDYDRFWQTSRAHHVGSSDFMALTKAIIARVTDRPTVRPPASTNGQSSTEDASTHTLSARDKEAITLLAGRKARPDLAGFVVVRAEAADPELVLA